MPRRDPAYWQRLRRDRRSNIAAGLGVLAALAATLSVVALAVPGPQSVARGNPLYWLLMLPMAWWGSGLARFEARPVRWWKPVLALSCLLSCGTLAMVLARGEDSTAQAIACGVTLLAAGASLWLLRGSLVALEGPAR